VKQSSALCIALAGKNRRIAGEQMNRCLFGGKKNLREGIESPRQSKFRSRNELRVKENHL
jgi:hypothetical protein